jgi:hypothetical protein
MRLLLVSDGRVINWVDGESVEAAQQMVPSMLVLDGTNGGEIGDRWDGTQLLPGLPPTPQVPASVTPRQIRQALTQTGLRESVESFIASQPQDVRDWWQFATEFQRDHPLVAATGQVLNKSPAELDALWILAGSL